MIIGSARNKSVAESTEFFFKCFGILDDLALVLFEFGSLGLLEGDS